MAFLARIQRPGAAALIYEVTWTRMLTLEMGHGVEAASTVLAAFMGGLAIGSAVQTWRCWMQAGRPREAARRYAEALVLDATLETGRRGLEEATANR